MRIAIEARALAAAGGGVRRYVDELTRALPKISGDDKFILWKSRPAHDSLLPWWLNISLPRWLREIHPDVIHFTKAAMPRRKIAPSVVTIYDVIPILFPESQKMTRRFLWPGMLKHAARASDQVITISESSKRDIEQYLGVSAQKVTVTQLAVDLNTFGPQKATDFVRRVSSDTPYVLFVGTIEPRKNVPLLVRAFTRIARDIPQQLIIAGRPYKGAMELGRAVGESGLSSRIKRVSNVPPDDLPSLYANADLFVWPSVYEGWGFPPQEAMACGTPVIVSDGGSLPEVVGDAGRVVPFAAPLRGRTQDTDFEERLAAVILEILGRSDERAVMRQRGLERVKSFSWEGVAQKTLEVYKKAAI